MGNYNESGHSMYASKGKGNAALTLGIIGTGLAAMNTNNCGRGCNNGLLGGLFGGNNGCYVDEKEFQWAQAWNASQAELAKEKSERYADGIGLSVYQQLVGERKEIDAAQNEAFRYLYGVINDQKAELAVLKSDISCLSVLNEEQHKAIATKAATDVQLESERRACADDSILTYVKSNYIKGTLKLDADDICPEVQLKCPDVQLVQLVTDAVTVALSKK